MTFCCLLNPFFGLELFLQLPNFSSGTTITKFWRKPSPNRAIEALCRSLKVLTLIFSPLDLSLKEILTLIFSPINPNFKEILYISFRSLNLNEKEMLPLSFRPRNFSLKEILTPNFSLLNPSFSPLDLCLKKYLISVLALLILF